MSRGARLVTGGTENHLVLLDVSSFGITGRQAESALLDAGIVTNRNSVPRDPNGAWYTTGVRLGTPALTSRGLGTAELDKVAELIVGVLSATLGAGRAGRLTVEGPLLAAGRCCRPYARRGLAAAFRAPRSTRASTSADPHCPGRSGSDQLGSAPSVPVRQ